MRWLERYLTEGSPRLGPSPRSRRVSRSASPRLASYLRIEERELGARAGGLNELLDSC